MVVFLLAIVLFNQMFPLALNLAIALISVMGVVEIISALGMSKNYILLIPSVVFAAVLPLLQGTWQQAAYYIYTVVIFSALIFYHQLFTFREIGVVYSMSLLIPTALQTLVGLRESGGGHGMFYVIIAIFSAWIADAGAFFEEASGGNGSYAHRSARKKRWRV